MKDLTTPINNPSEFRPFNLWMNEHRHDELHPYEYQFSFFDLDGVLFTIRKDKFYFQLIEVKTHGKSILRPSQKAGLLTLDKILSHCVPTDVKDMLEVNGYDFRGGRRVYSVYYLGLHILILSGDRPDNSEVIKWDGQVITLQQLYKNLRMS